MSAASSPSVLPDLFGALESKNPGIIVTALARFSDGVRAPPGVVERRGSEGRVYWTASDSARAGRTKREWVLASTRAEINERLAFACLCLWPTLVEEAFEDGEQHLFDDGSLFTVLDEIADLIPDEREWVEDYDAKRTE